MKKTGVLFILMILAAGPVRAEAFKTYYPNGKVQVDISDQGTKTYYENGQMSTDTPMLNGMAEGTAKAYDDKGRVLSEVHHRKGQIVGKSKFYGENGKVIREENHDEGRWKQFDESGRVVDEGKLQ